MLLLISQACSGGCWTRNAAPILLTQKCGSFFSKPAANQKRQTQTISLSKLLISSVFLYVSSGVFCVKRPNNPDPETLTQKPRYFGLLRLTSAYFPDP